MCLRIVKHIFGIRELGGGSATGCCGRGGDGVERGDPIRRGDVFDGDAAGEERIPLHALDDFDRAGV